MLVRGRLEILLSMSFSNPQFPSLYWANSTCLHLSDSESEVPGSRYASVGSDQADESLFRSGSSSSRIGRREIINTHEKRAGSQNKVEKKQ